MDNNVIMNNVAIYIDYENVYKSLAVQYKNLLREGFFEKMQQWCKNRQLRIVKIVAYCNFDNEDLHESYHQTLLQEYGVSTIHTSNRGKNYADMQIAIDAINDMYLNQNIDQFIIMSNDKDMSPLLNTIKSNKRKSILLTVGDTYDYALCNVPDEHISIDEIFSVDYEDNLYITRYENRILGNISKFYGEPPYNRKLELEYCIRNQMCHNHIMKYELLNIFKLLQEKNQIFFFHYMYNGKECTGVAPTTVQSNCSEDEFINNEDIFNYDFGSQITNLYDKVKSKTSDKN